MKNLGTEFEIAVLKLKNAAGTFVNSFANATTAARTWTFPDKDITVAGLDDISADSAVTSGWIGLGVCTYESADSPTFQFSIASDVTGIIGVGMRIKLTQTTTKYFIVTAVGAYSGGKTIITVYGGTDYTLANAAITNAYYATVDAPFGFPLTQDKWTVSLTDTTTRSQASPTAGVVYNPGSLSLSMPIGAWIPTLECSISGTKANNTLNVFVTVSTANSTANVDFRGFVAGYNDLASSLSIASEVISAASKTTYYVNLYTNTASLNNISLANGSDKLSLKFKSAFL